VIHRESASSRARLRANALERVKDGRLGTPLATTPERKQWRSLADLHPDLAGELNRTRNGSLDPAMLGVWSSELVWWRCARCGHEWQARVMNRAGVGGGCPACGPRATRRRGPAASTPGPLSPELVAQLHPTRNGDLEPATIDGGSTRKLWWVCGECRQEWQSSPRSRAWRSSSGCPRCQGSSWVPNRGIVPRERSLAARRPDLAGELHPTRNENLDPWTVGAWSKRAVWWVCSACGHEWHALISTRNQGSGCPRCAQARRAATYEANARQRPREPAD
jgi:DNA-directed RNA polymerase subunit RPC12/RpoP